MNNEQAIDRLRKISEKTPIRTNGDDLVAITMAIKALEQQKVKEIQGIMEGGWTVTFEVPEQEPCEDAISQNQSNACSILDDECPYPYMHCWECPLNYQYELAKHELDKNVDLPSVTHKSGKWIPVSERLPEDRDWYLGIFKEMDTGWINPLPFICEYVGTKTKFTTEDFWIIRCGSDREDDSGDYYSSLRCVAWMPLPEPYEPQESEE